MSQGDLAKAINAKATVVQECEYRVLALVCQVIQLITSMIPPFRH